MALPAFDFRRLWDVVRTPVQRPTDVLNLIDYADRHYYRWYGAFVMPTIYGVGGSLRWGGHHRESIVGEPLADTLLVVRYPTHRHFIFMTVNPYYALINRLRERGVARFAAAFTRVVVADQNLNEERRLVGVHFTAPEPATVVDALASSPALRAAGLELAYASAQFAAFDFLRAPKPNDPNPLPFPATALFRCADVERLHAARPAVRGALEGLGFPVAAHLYERLRRGDVVPRLTRTAEEVRAS